MKIERMKKDYENQLLECFLGEIFFELLLIPIHF